MRRVRNRVPWVSRRRLERVQAERDELRAVIRRAAAAVRTEMTRHRYDNTALLGDMRITALLDTDEEEAAHGD